MLKYASLTLPRGYNIEKGRGGQKVKIWDWKTHAFSETGLFRGVSQLLLSIIVALGLKISVYAQLGLRVAFTSVWDTFCIFGKTMTCDLCFVPAAL